VVAGPARFVMAPQWVDQFGPTSWRPYDEGSNVRCSLIVLNFNGLHLLRPCLASLLAAVEPSDEIIVVDNGSTDGSADAIASEFPSVRLVRLPENSFIFGLNAGLARSRGRFVAFLNNDMTVEADFVAKALRGFSEPDVFAVCPRILDGQGIDQGSRTAGYYARGLLFYCSLPHVDRATDCFFAVGGQSFFRRDALIRLGSIDPLLWPMYHEDIELSYRAWKAGWRIRYAPDAVCHHTGSQTSRRMFTPAELRSFVRQNEILIVWKDVTDRPLMVEHLVSILPRLAAAVAKRDWSTLVGFGRAVRRLPRVLAGRRQARDSFVRSDREVLQLVSAEAIDGAARAAVPEAQM
jgi:GT2 family glycosyltransferase